MGLLPLLVSAIVLFPGLRPTLDQRAVEALIWGVLPMLGVGAFAWAGWQESRIFQRPNRTPAQAKASDDSAPPRP